MANKKPTKIEYANAIGAILKMSDSEILSLNKAGAKPLEMIFNALANSKPIQ